MQAGGTGADHGLAITLGDCVADKEPGAELVDIPVAALAVMQNVEVERSASRPGVSQLAAGGGMNEGFETRPVFRHEIAWGIAGNAGTAARIGNLAGKADSFRRSSRQAQIESRELARKIGGEVAVQAIGKPAVRKHPA